LGDSLTRKVCNFEYVFGDVLRKREHVVLTGGGLGSHQTLRTVRRP
jgi:hypothetical protein